MNVVNVVLLVQQINYQKSNHSPKFVFPCCTSQKNLRSFPESTLGRTTENSGKECTRENFVPGTRENLTVISSLGKMWILPEKNAKRTEKNRKEWKRMEKNGINWGKQVIQYIHLFRK